MPAARRSLHTVPVELRRLLGAVDDGDAPSTSLGGWILQSLSRRVVMVCIGMATVLAMRGAGLFIPGAVFALLSGWLLVAVLLFLRYRHHALPRAFWRVHFGAQLVDLSATLALAHLTGSLLWLAPLLMAMTVSLGGQTLPRLYGVLLSVIASSAYAVALLGEVLVWWPVRGPFAPTSQPTLGAAIGVMVAVAIVLVAIASVQRSYFRHVATVEQRHARVLDTTADMIVTVDRDGRYLSANAAVERTLGWTREHIIGDTIFDSIDAVDQDRAKAAFIEVLRGHTISEDLLVRAADESRRTLATTGAPILGEDGAVVAAIFIGRDVTAQREAERERDALQARLEESRRIEAIGRLVSGVAHELNNPLAAILTFAEQLRAEPRSPADDAALTTIYGQAIRSRAIVRDLLTFVRPGQHRAQARLELAPVVEGALRALEPHVSLLGVRLVRDVAIPDVWIEGDASGVEQVVTNLVLNAAQAAGAGGTVWVRARVSAGQATIAVEDSGAGIAESSLPHLFEPFFTTKPVGQGTGLGLFVSLGVAQRHQGTLRAGNRPEGGARFEFVLPTSAPAPVAPRRTTPTPAVTTVMLRPRALLVDDEDAIRSSLRRYFVRRGWEVSEAADGAAALEVIRSFGEAAITLIVCDLRMPGMNGAQLHAVLEAEHPALLERMILASGDIVSPEVAGLLSTTRCRVLEKPFELASLGQVADEVLGDLVPGPAVE